MRHTREPGELLCHRFGNMFGWGLLLSQRRGWFGVQTLSLKFLVEELSDCPSGCVCSDHHLDVRA